MKAFLDWFWAFWASYGPWIATALIPTIITGLSKSSSTAAAGTWVAKAWAVFKQVLDFLSILTHKDKPGTFQAPLKLSRLSKKEGPPPSIGPGCAAIFFIALALNQSACGWLKSDTATNIKNSTIDCTIEAVKSNAASLLPLVMAVVTGNADNWQQQLGAIAKEFGKDALACSLHMAAEELEESVKVSGGHGEGSADATGLVKTRQFIREHKYTYVNVE